MALSVLVCDDTVFMRLMLKDMLEKHGYIVAGEAQNGREAIEQYKALKPDIVTMDITMPDMNGIEAVKQIRAFDPKAKIVMCSAMGQQALVLEAIQAGASEFIVKPFHADRVMDALQKVMTF